MSETAPKLLTGRKVLIFTLMAFGTIITANLSLVYFAIGSFPGLEVKNTYVASQQFEAAKTAQEALDWHVEANYQDGQLDLSFREADGQPVEVTQITASIGRATHAGEDRQVFFELVGNRYLAPARLDAGNWQLRINTVAKDGTRFWQHIPLNVGR